MLVNKAEAEKPVENKMLSRYEARQRGGYQRVSFFEVTSQLRMKFGAQEQQVDIAIAIISEPQCNALDRYTTLDLGVA